MVLGSGMGLALGLGLGLALGLGFGLGLGLEPAGRAAPLELGVLPLEPRGAARVAHKVRGEFGLAFGPASRRRVVQT